MDFYEAMALRARGRHLYFVVWYALQALQHIGPSIPLAEVPMQVNVSHPALFYASPYCHEPGLSLC